MTVTSPRHVRAGALSAFLLVWGAAPAVANDRTDQGPQPTLVPTLAAADAFVPSVSLATITFDQLAPQSVLTAPRNPELGGLSGPLLRRSLIVSFGALQMLDAHSTTKALAAGGREANPAMGAIASNPTALYAVKAGTFAATAYLAERISRKHPKRAVVLMAVLNSAYVAIVAHNYRVANGGR